MIANIVARENVKSVREALRALGLVVAEIDLGLRYVWIDNAHPDFDSNAVVGKRDDELIGPDAAEDIMRLKRDVIAGGMPQTRTLRFQRSDGLRVYNMSAVPVQENSGRVVGVITAAVDVTEVANRDR